MNGRAYGDRFDEAMEPLSEHASEAMTEMAREIERLIMLSRCQMHLAHQSLRTANAYISMMGNREPPIGGANLET